MVYEKYIKGKPHVVTSFVPKGQTASMAENSVPAGVKEENINEASQVEIAATANDSIVKTPSLLTELSNLPLERLLKLKYLSSGKLHWPMASMFME